MNLDNLYLNYKFKEKYKMQILFPHGFHKITKDGYPVVFGIIGNVKYLKCLNLQHMKNW